jgi:hypothetical protein
MFALLFGLAAAQPFAAQGAVDDGPAGLDGTRSASELPDAVPMECVPGKRVRLGRPAGFDATRFDSERPRTVRTPPVLVALTELTNTQLAALSGLGMGNLSTSETCGPECPALVTWLDAVRIANALSDLHGLERAYDVDDDSRWVTWDRDAPGFRLPTPEEWESAALVFNSYEVDPIDALEKKAWFHVNSEKRLHPVCSTPWHRDGCDFAGNAREWTWSTPVNRFGYLHGGRLKYLGTHSPDSIASGGTSQVRGGSYSSVSTDIRPWSVKFEEGHWANGVRLVRSGDCRLPPPLRHSVMRRF